jgi:hypothetical protein
MNLLFVQKLGYLQSKVPKKLFTLSDRHGSGFSRKVGSSSSSSEQESSEDMKSMFMTFSHFSNLAESFLRILRAALSRQSLFCG